MGVQEQTKPYGEKDAFKSLVLSGFLLWMTLLGIKNDRRKRSGMWKKFSLYKLWKAKVSSK